MGNRQYDHKQMSTDALALRKRAEEQARAMGPISLSARTPEEIQQMIHELRVDQIELEMQKEEFRTAQDQIEAGRRRYFELYDQAPVGYCTLSEHGVILEANRTAATLLGETRGALVMHLFSRFIHSDDQDICSLHRKQLLETGEPQECILRLIKSDGTLLWAHLTGNAVHSEEAAPLCRVVLTDITTLKRHEEELRIERELSERIIEDGPVAITQVDSNGKIVFANSQAEDLLGLKKPTIEALGYNAPEWLITDVDGAPLPDERLPFSQIMLTGRAVYNVLHAISTPGAARKILSINGAPLHDEQGRIDRVVFAIQDITELKRAEEENRRFRTITDNALYGKAIADLEGNLLYVNHFFADIHGYSPEYLAGRHLSLLHSQEQMETVDRLVAAIIREGHFTPTTVWHRHQDGRIFPMLMSGILVKDDHGNPQCIAASAIDMSAQHQAENALRESVELLKEIVESSLSGFWDWNLVDNTEYLSPTFKQMFGYEDHEMENSPDVWQKMIFPEDLPGVLEVFDRHVKSRGLAPFYNEVRYRHRDGSTVWVICAGRVIEWADDGSAIRMVGCHVDITKLKQAEAALRASEETHRALVSGLPDTVMRFDREGRHLFVSENRKVLDIEAAEFIGKTHTELGFPEAKCRFWDDSIQRVLDSGEPFETEFTFEGKAGVAIFNWRLIPERDGQGAVSSVLSISRNITAHRQAEMEYKTLFREMLNGFALHEIICDPAGRPVDYRYLAVNPAFERLTGLKAETVLGRTALEILPGTDKHLIGTYGNVALSGEPVFFEHYFVELGKHFEVTAFCPIAGQFASIFQDITERKKSAAEREKLQAQLAQAQKMESVGRLAGGVAHDFNNMLMVILGHTEMALDQIPPEEPLHAGLEAIQEAAQHSADLTQQLLAYARQQVVAPRVVDINDTVEKMLKLLRRLIGEDIDLSWRPGQGVWPIKMDTAQLNKILANLVVNSRDAIAGVGKVTIETSNAVFDAEYCARNAGAMTGDYVLLAVSDNGCGMDAETQSQIFEPFFTTKELGKGTGLGLATVYGVVKQNNGIVTVYSEPGQGTTFRIYLPRHAVKAEIETEGNRPEAAARGSETVLLVEDEPAILTMATMMLQRMGYTVLAAGTPGAAIHLAREHSGRIDLLMTDVVMPEMNGRDLGRNLLSIYPDLRRLFMSGYTANVIAHHGVLDEGVHFIQKPFTLKELGAKLRVVLES